MDQSRSYREIATEILREAEETDRREDERFGDRRGDELPEQLHTPEGRRAALEQAKRRIQERKGQAVNADHETGEAGEVVIDPQRSLCGHGGREWFRIARRELAQHRERAGRAVARELDDRLFDAAGRLEQNHQVELAANQLYERWRAGRGDWRGRRLHANNLKPFVAASAAGDDQPV
jgi:hypothetical protein